MRQISAAEARNRKPLFLKDEVLFNLLYRLIEADDALVMTDGVSVVLAQTAPEKDAWIWTAPDIGADALEALQVAVRARAIRQAMARPASLCTCTAIQWCGNG